MRTLKDLLAPAVLPASALNKGGDTLLGAINNAVHATLASASTIDIGAAASNSITVTGTAAITSLGTIADGAVRTLTFTAALVLTHNAVSLILPTGSNIATEAGDVVEFTSLGSGNWRCTAYQRATGVPIAPVKTVSGKSIFGVGDIAGGMIPTAVKSIAYTAVANDMVRVDPTASAFTVSLPAAPADGDLVGVFDVTNKCGVHAVLLAATGGKTVEGDATGMSIDVPGSFVVVMYNAATGNWKLQMTPLQASGILGIDHGGTGATTAAAALAALGGAPVGGYTVQLIVGTTQLAVKNTHYVITNVAATEVTLMVAPVEGDVVVVTVDNGLMTNTMNFNGKNHEQSTDATMSIDSNRATITWRFLNNKWRII